MRRETGATIKRKLRHCVIIPVLFFVFFPLFTRAAADDKNISKAVLFIRGCFQFAVTLPRNLSCGGECLVSFCGNKKMF